MSEYLAGKTVSEGQLGEWVERFHREGYLFIENVLPPEWCRELREDLDRALAEQDGPLSGSVELHHRMFERSRANLRLFDVEPIVSLAEALITGACHVIHNNSFRVQHGHGITGWHQDDPAHFLVTHGEPPANIRLPVLLFTGNYLLTDAPEVIHGPTQVVPGSHLFGAGPPKSIEGTPWESRVISGAGMAGSVTLFNCQVWHRGAPNMSDRVRYITQITYARRIVGHKYYPFMNYQMPEHVYADANPRLKRLLGFLPRGAYG